MEIYQTTIQHFFVSNGIDYAMAVETTNDVILSATHEVAMSKHMEIVERNRQYEHEWCDTSYNEEMKWDITRIHYKGGRRTIIITQPKELNQ